MPPVLPAGLKVGAVSYLNTKPLIHGLDGLVLDVPANLAWEFYDGELDVALLPVFAVLKAGGGHVVDDVAIGCRGKVHSVFVASRARFEESEEIWLDPSSRSSSALLRVLLAEFYPESHHIRESGDVPPDAAHLLIGDPAIRFRQRHGDTWQYHDLGALWQKHTGLPFVFAVWAMGDQVDPRIAGMLRGCKASGLVAVEEIAAREADPAFARRYLTEHIQFDLRDEQKEAIRLFERLARQHGILPAGEPVPLIWH